MLRASLALNRHQPSKAIELLESAAPYELGTPRSNLQGFFGALYPVYMRGEAYLAAQLQLGRTYATAGDKAKAKTAYQTFLNIWKDADPDIPILEQAKAEYAKLQ